jgi:hypothetical protein
LEGKVIKSVKQKQDEGTGLRLKSVTDYECTDYYWVQWYMDCTVWYDQFEVYTSTYCGEPYAEWTYLYTECIDDGYGGDGGGGSGGGEGEYNPPPPPDTCTCTICLICGGCRTPANSTECPPPCPGHRNSLFDNAVYGVQGLTSSSIKNYIASAMNEGRISVNSSANNPIFSMQYVTNLVKPVYTVSMNQGYFISLDNGTKMIMAHEFYHIYRVESGYGNGSDANDTQHTSMLIDPDYKAMLMEIFPGHDTAFYDMLKMAGTQGSPIFEDLPQPDKDALYVFFLQNGIY